MTLGFTVIVSILAPTLIGLLLDETCGIRPWGCHRRHPLRGWVCVCGLMAADENEIRKTYA